MANACPRHCRLRYATVRLKIAARFNDLALAAKGPAIASLDGELGLLNSDGSYAAAPAYSELALLSSGEFFYSRPTYRGDTSSVRESGRMSRTGKVLTMVRGELCGSG